MRLRTTIGLLTVTPGLLLTLSGNSMAQHAEIRRTVASVGDLARPGDVWVETVHVGTESGARLTVDVGRLVIPENRKRPDSNSIQIAFARIRSTGVEVRAPLVYLAGGPGGSATWEVSEPSALERWLPMLTDGDVVLLDQRGAGESSPTLRWRRPGRPVLEAFADRAALDALAVEMASRARAELTAAGHDLAGYTTEQSARDIDALRQALGAERLNLLGFSYGTHLAIAYARLFPDRLESMVLSGVEGPDQTMKLPLHMDTQFRKLALMVREDPALGGRIPDLVALLERVQRRLEAEPMPVRLENPETGVTYEVAVGRHFLDFILRMDIGDARDVPVFPRLLYGIDSGDPSVLSWFVQRRAVILLGVDGMSAVMDLASGASPGRRALIEEQARRSLFGGVVNYPMLLWDEAWQAPDLGEEHRAPLVSDVRALLLSGSLDWNTPPFQAEQLKWGLTHATHLVVENAGHEQVLPNQEIWDAIARFLRGEDVSDVRATAPPIRWVPLEGYDPDRWHPSVPRK